MGIRKTYTGKEKFRIALEAAKCNLTTAEISAKYQVSPSLIHKWKVQLLDLGNEIFERGAKSTDDKLVFEHEQLLRKVGQMSLEIDFLKKAYASV